MQPAGLCALAWLPIALYGLSGIISNVTSMLMNAKCMEREIGTVNRQGKNVSTEVMQVGS